MLVHRAIGEGNAADIDSIHNYYEHLVVELLLNNHERFKVTPSMIPDVACVALNNLPPRYIRHDVDMAFYLSPDEYQEMESKVENTVINAIKFVNNRVTR